MCPVEFFIGFFSSVTVLALKQVEPVDEATAQAAAAKHASLHADTVGVDAPADTDLFYRLQIDRCFFVRGLGSVGQAEIISGEVCSRLSWRSPIAVHMAGLSPCFPSRILTSSFFVLFLARRLSGCPSSVSVPHCAVRPSVPAKETSCLLLLGTLGPPLPRPSRGWGKGVREEARAPCRDQCVCCPLLTQHSYDLADGYTS